MHLPPESRDLIDEVVQSINARRLVIFAGAGISKASGLPTAQEIIGRVVRHIVAQSSLPKAGVSELQQRAHEELRLEVVIRILIDVIGDRGLMPLQMLATGKPSFAHRFLAARMREALVPTVLTTNFDTLIEEACSNAGLDLRCLIDDADYDHPDHFQDVTRLPTLVKLHGSLAIQSELQSRAIFADVRRIGQGLGTKRTQLLRSILREHCLLVLGYSGRDYFGAMPEIYGSHGPTIFWVFHKSTHGGLDTHVRKWLEISGRGHVVDVDTESWLSSLASRLGVSIGTNTTETAERANAPSVEADLVVSESQANLLGTLLLSKLGSFDTAAECFRTTIERCQAQQSPNEAEMIQAFIEGGRLSLRLGERQLTRYELAHGLFSRAYELSTNHPKLRLDCHIALLETQFCIEWLLYRTPVQYLTGCGKRPV